MKLLEIYNTDGTELLYTFGNEEELYTYGDRMKYGSIKYSQRKNDGVIVNADAFFEADSLCTLLTSGEVSCTINSYQPISIPKKARCKLYRHSGELLVVFEAKDIQRTAMHTYTLQGYDYIGKAEEIRSKGFYIENESLEFVMQTAFVENGIPIVFDDDVRTLTVSGSALPDEYSLREMLQLLCLGYGLRASTIGVEGISITSKDINHDTHHYTASELLENPAIEDLNRTVGTLTINRTMVVEGESPVKTKTHGYVPIDRNAENTTVMFNSVSDPIDRTLFPEDVVYDENHYASPSNGIKSGTKQAVLMGVDLEQRVNNYPWAPKYVSDYASATITANNGVKITLNTSNLVSVADASDNDRGASGYAWLMRPTIADATHALVAIADLKWGTDTDVEEYAETTIDNSQNTTTLETPFVSGGMLSDIENYYKRTHQVSFGCKFTDEKLFTVAYLPSIYDDSLYAQIEKITLSFGAYSIFANITASVIGFTD